MTGAQGVVINVALVLVGFNMAVAAVVSRLQSERMVDRWIEHCVQQVRPKYQADERARCEAEAEEWRYGNEPPFDWASYDESMERLLDRADQTPECRAADEALRRCNEALRAP